MSLYDELRKLNNSDMLPLHMPGHKRSDKLQNMSEIYDIDITEIDGFDDLHNPSGILLDIKKQAARIYGCTEAYISVNGSTAANEAAILAVSKPGQKIIMPRASHKSIYYAVEVGDLIPIYLDYKTIPDADISAPVMACDVRNALDENPDCKTVIITSPTYEGIIADISSIADVVHECGGVLIVDSAHGAHLGLADCVPKSAISEGTDICITSLHKTLPSPTQTALLLANGDRVPYQRLKHFCSVFQSSSPSYVLMAGIGECLDYIEDGAEADLKLLTELASSFREKLKGLQYIDVCPVKDNLNIDSGKLVIKSRIEGYSGADLFQELLSEYHIQCEMHGTDYVLAMFTVMDDEQCFDRLSDALVQIDDRLASCSFEKKKKEYVEYPKPEKKLEIRNASNLEQDVIDIKDACGRISADYVMAYPPGIPVLVPGELIDKQVITYLINGLEIGLNIIGIDDNKISVVK